MKPTLIVECGVIGLDGKLRLPMDRVVDFCGQHPGERALVKVEALDGHATGATFRYYFGYILPTVRRGFYNKGIRATEADVHEVLWHRYPGEHNPDGDIREAPASQVGDYIDWLKEVCAEYLDIYIEDAI